MDEKTLKEILEQHKLWIESRTDEGNRANLSGANLHGANLSGADLRGADLRGAILHKVNFSRANLRGAELSNSDLSNADLSNASLFCADLHSANLSGANLRGAELSNSDLSNADISNASLFCADLSNADLSDAYLRGVNLSGATNVPFIPMACPDSGSFIGWKKASSYIVKLLIPEDARRSSSAGRKCRADKAIVLAIENIDGGTSKLKEVHSTYDSEFMYRVGEMAIVDNYDENRFNECAPGIHFFINRQEAVEY